VDDLHRLNAIARAAIPRGRRQRVPSRRNVALDRHLADFAAARQRHVRQIEVPQMGIVVMDYASECRLLVKRFEVIGNRWSGQFAFGIQREGAALRLPECYEGEYCDYCEELTFHFPFFPFVLNLYFYSSPCSALPKICSQWFWPVTFGDLDTC
jgi:hypothetical protein